MTKATTPTLSMQNYFSTTLSAGVVSSDTVFYLTQMPTASEGYLELDEGLSSKEIIYYTSKGSNFVTCPDATAGSGRGVGGTTPAAHAQNAVVKQKINAEYWTELQNGDALAALVKGGWFAGISTWVYASATTLTVSATEAASMSVGTKLQLTQTTVKYFYVTGVSGTTITVTGGSDYTLASAAITSPSWSNATSPVGFPTWFTYSATFAGFSVNPTGVFSRFKIEGRSCTVAHYETAAGTSNATTFTISLPVTAATISGANWLVLCSVANSGSFAAGIAAVSSASTVMGFGKDVSNNNFTNSGLKQCLGVELIYEI
jgi:hypothetical protein